MLRNARAIWKQDPNVEQKSNGKELSTRLFRILNIECFDLEDHSNPMSLLVASGLK